MTADLLSYEKLVREALRGVIREVLNIVSKRGFPGNHHFYIKFLTKHPGVILSEELQRSYPTEMTIVLQYQFFDLQVDQESFSVILNFNNISERVTVPYDAIMLFFDPSVNFAIPLHIGASDEPPLHPSQPNAKDEKRGKVVTLDVFRKGKRDEDKE